MNPLVTLRVTVKLMATPASDHHDNWSAPFHGSHAGVKKFSWTCFWLTIDQGLHQGDYWPFLLYIIVTIWFCCVSGLIQNNLLWFLSWQIHDSISWQPWQEPAHLSVIGLLTVGWKACRHVKDHLVSRGGVIRRCVARRPVLLQPAQKALVILQINLSHKQTVVTQDVVKQKHNGAVRNGTKCLKQYMTWKSGQLIKTCHYLYLE